MPAYKLHLISLGLLASHSSLPFATSSSSRAFSLRFPLSDLPGDHLYLHISLRCAVSLDLVLLVTSPAPASSTLSTFADATTCFVFLRVES
ncbi:unnamed protein product, partial [Mycena citricolor]